MLLLNDNNNSSSSNSPKLAIASNHAEEDSKPTRVDLQALFVKMRIATILILYNHLNHHLNDHHSVISHQVPPKPSQNDMPYMPTRVDMDMRLVSL